MNSSNQKDDPETRIERRIRRLKNSLRKRLFQKRASAQVPQTRSAWERIATRVTGHISFYGNKFDLNHPRMIDGIRSALEKGTYESREIQLIDRFVRPDDRVVELGACLGATSLFLFDRVGEDGLIVFEADPRNLEMAQHNFRLNKKPVRCEHAVLWSGQDRPETIAFGSNENPSSSSLLDRDGQVVMVEVKTHQFETALRDHKATAIVLDIEGGEIDLFNNAIDLDGIRLILLETHARFTGTSANEKMIDGLKNRGFSIVESLRDGDFLALERVQ